MQASAAHIIRPPDKLCQLISTGEPGGVSHLAPGDATTCAASWVHLWERAILGRFAKVTCIEGILYLLTSLSMVVVGSIASLNFCFL